MGKILMRFHMALWKNAHGSVFDVTHTFNYFYISSDFHGEINFSYIFPRKRNSQQNVLPRSSISRQFLSSYQVFVFMKLSKSVHYLQHHVGKENGSCKLWVHPWCTRNICNGYHLHSLNRLNGIATYIFLFYLWQQNWKTPASNNALKALSLCLELLYKTLYWQFRVS